MPSRTPIRVLQILAGALLGLSAALWWMGREVGEPSPEAVDAGYFLPSPLPSPDFSLTSQDGVPRSSRTFGQEILVVYFGYTFCPDVCPLTLSNLSRAFRAMGEEGDRIQVVLITVDPARDTPERLEGYLTNFHPSFVGFTGSEEEIRAVADGFGAYFARGEGEEGYTVDHTSRAFVLGRDREIVLTFPVTASPQEMARDLTILLQREGRKEG